MILLIDNYDSFTYNLYQYISEISPNVCVLRNDCVTIEDIRELNPSHIVFSPGPGYPKDAGNMEEIIHSFHQSIPMLGICLGHQAIAEVFDSHITQAKEMKHGEQDTIQLDVHSPLFSNLNNTIPVARYHSLIACNLPSCLKTIAISNEGEIMAIQHNTYPIYGVQFHPESIMTPDGKQILENFIKGEHNAC